MMKEQGKMTKERRKKIGLIAVLVFLAATSVNGFTINVMLLNILALLALVVVALICTMFYIRDNGPLSQRDMMKEIAPVILILLLMVFVVPEMIK